MKGAVLVCFLLALAACGRAPSSNGGATMSAPSPTTGRSGDEPDGSGPRNSFIVCPGNPRCPPEGSQPKGSGGN